MCEWTELGFSSIYYLLNKLEAAELIESALEQSPGRGPARKVYSITEAGWKTCQQGILESLSEPPRPESMFLLGMSNLPTVPREQALAALHLYETNLAERREHLQERMKIGEGAFPFHVGAMFEFSLIMIQAELVWLEGFIQKLEAQDGKERF
jgi:DNA-binding PadR family transcriptional regulator